MNTRLWIMAVVLIAALNVSNASHDHGAKQKTLPNLDFRKTSANKVAPKVVASEVDALRSKVPSAKVSLDEVTGVPKRLQAGNGFLSGPSSATNSHKIVKDFVNDNSALFGHNATLLDGARIKTDHVAAHNGLRTLVWEQRVDDIPVLGGQFTAHITKKGELVDVSSGVVPDGNGAADKGVKNRQKLVSKPAVSAVKALALAAANLSGTVDEVNVNVASTPQGKELKQTLRAPGVRGDAYATLTWLPTSRDSMRLCWRVILSAKPQVGMYSMMVDAETGEVLVRTSLTSDATDATYNVYTSDSPTPFSPGLPTPSGFQPPEVPRSLVTLTALSTNASPAGWIPDNGTNTFGNNVHAHTDTNDDDIPDLPRPSSTNRVFDFPLDLTKAPNIYSKASVVQLFYLNNVIHDRLYDLGFTEAFGNFQTTNFNRGGAGNDAVQADAQDGGGFNNANMSTPPDGFPPRMQMYLFDGPTPDRDGSLDAEIVFHEYVHGLSGRLVGRDVGINALQTGGMGEGWSDFYALALLSEPQDDIGGNYAVGGYDTKNLFGLSDNYYYGIRRYPYSTNLLKNPLTYKDIDPDQASAHPGIPVSPLFGGSPADEVHNIGEVWCVALWEVRASLVAKWDWQIGNQLTLQLVTDGMKLGPVDPTILEARDAIILADRVSSGGENYSELWIAFAKRGMGLSATSPDSDTANGVVEAYDLPPDVTVDIPDGVLEVAITPQDSAAVLVGNAIPVFVRVTDGGPVRNATVTATIAGVGPLAFSNDGIAPDQVSSNGIYTATLLPAASPTTLVLTVIISAPGKDTSTNTVSYTVVSAAGNDNIAQAYKILAGGTNIVTTTVAATLEPSEPLHAGAPGVTGSLWWKYSSPSNVNLLIDTGGSLFDTVIAVYTNTTAAVTNLTPIIAADDIGARKQAFLYLNALAGRNYYITVAGHDPTSTGTLRLACVINGVPDTNAPVVTILTPLSGTALLTNRAVLTGNMLDPQPNATGIRDLSIRVTGVVDGTPSSHEIVIYPSVSEMGPTVTNWSSTIGLLRGHNTIEAIATDYAGNKSTPQVIQILSRSVLLDNDLFVDAIDLPGASGSVAGNTLLATMELGEPRHAGIDGGKSVWWKFTPTQDGILNLTTTNSGFDTLLAVYRGTSVSSAQTIVANDDAYAGSGFSVVDAPVRSGFTYRIAVDGYVGEVGAVSLSYAFTPATLVTVATAAGVGGAVAPGTSDYLSGTVVTLTAAPVAFSEFDSWQGSFSSLSNPLVVTATSDLSFTASFRPIAYTDGFESGTLGQLNWVSSGNAPWIIQTNTVRAGSFAARSGVIPHSGNSSLSLTTEFQAGYGGFDYKVSSEVGWDFLRFYLDGILLQQWSGEQGWANYQFPITAGSHTVEWRYVKDASNVSGQDAAFLDNIILPLSVAVNASAPAQLKIYRLENGTVYVDVQGQAHQRYITQAASQPGQWTSISTNSTPTGFFRIVDSSSPSTVRYYRAFVPAP